MPMDQVIKASQEFLRAEGLPGWLVYDYRGLNPIFRQVITPSGHVTRQCFFFIPASGQPRLLVHHVDAGKFAGSTTELGAELVVYRSRESMLEGLQGILKGPANNPVRVAMEYSPQNALPRVSRVDAGTIELVRSLGVEVVSSADVMQYATQRWSREQLEGHQRTTAKLGEIVNQAFGYIGERLSQRPTEFDVAEFIRARFREESLETPDGPIVSVNAHCSDPHYEPEEGSSSVIKSGDWVLIDLWAKSTAPAPSLTGEDTSPSSPLGESTASSSPQGGIATPSSPLAKGAPYGGQESVYGDITWVAYVGNAVPQRHQEIFDIVAGARDAALSFLEESHSKGETVQGWQADAVARDYIAQRGYGEFFTHRLGHSIGGEVHSEAVNLDGFETHDTRRIIPGVGFSIEPGIYLPEFGVRSEIDAYMSETGPYATSPIQREVVLIGGGR